MEIIYVTNSGFGLSDYHALPSLVSWIVVVGGFLGCIAFLAAWGFRRDNKALQRRVRQLELDLDQLAPRTVNLPRGGD